MTDRLEPDILITCETFSIPTTTRWVVWCNTLDVSNSSIMRLDALMLVLLWFSLWRRPLPFMPFFVEATHKATYSFRVFGVIVNQHGDNKDILQYYVRSSRTLRGGAMEDQASDNESLKRQVHQGSTTPRKSSSVQGGPPPPDDERLPQSVKAPPTRAESQDIPVPPPKVEASSKRDFPAIQSKLQYDNSNQQQQQQNRPEPQIKREVGSPQPSPPISKSHTVTSSTMAAETQACHDTAPPISDKEEMIAAHTNTQQQTKWRGLASPRHIWKQAAHQTRQKLHQFIASSGWRQDYDESTMDSEPIAHLPRDHPLVRSKLFLLRTVSLTMEALHRWNLVLRSTHLPNWLVHPSGGPTLLALYLLVLLASSCGFYVFLYFISLGYALGIGLPLSIALVHFVKTLNSQDGSEGQLWSLKVDHWFPGTSYQRTFLHTGLVILWSIRMFAFLLWREYWNWPALHERIMQVNRRRRPATASSWTNSSRPANSVVEGTSYTPQHQPSPPSLLIKTLCWLCYSFFYLCLLSPSYFRMRHDLLTTVTKASPSTWTTSLVEYAAIFVQVLGLVLETVADWQKSWFKSQPKCRYEWCGGNPPPSPESLSSSKPRFSLWQWSTHPNYLGEGLFWVGTVVGGMLPFVSEIITTATTTAVSSTVIEPTTIELVRQLGFMAVGLGFLLQVLRGAIFTMDQTQAIKYGHVPEYVAFRRDHGLWGPRRRPKGRQSSTIIIPNQSDLVREASSKKLPCEEKDDEQQEVSSSFPMNGPQKNEVKGTERPSLRLSSNVPDAASTMEET